MRRRVVIVVIAVVAAWVLAGDALGPFVSSGSPLSASAMRAALDARAEAVDGVRERMIELRQQQVALRDRVVALEELAAASSADGAVTAPLQANDGDPWTEAGIVAGQVADAEALNAIFERFVDDVADIRSFKGLLVLDQDALFGRLEALEASAGIVGPPVADPLAPDENDVSVPHVFTTGSAMRASEMNANLQAIDAALLAETAMAAAIDARQAVIEERIEALEALGAEPDPDPSIAAYVVGPGRVATVTSIEGVIDGYDGGEVEATFAGLMATIAQFCNDDGCQMIFSPGRPWVPTSIDAPGAFTIDLPASPSLDGVGSSILCGEEVVLSYSGALYVHDAPFGEPSSSPSVTYARVRLEEPKTPVNILADAAVLVWYAFTTDSVDLTCTQDESDFGTEPMTLDVDVRLRPGWNVMTWLQRSEGDDMVLYMRTGEPGLSLPWVVPEQLY